MDRGCQSQQQVNLPIWQQLRLLANALIDATNLGSNSVESYSQQ